MHKQGTYDNFNYNKWWEQWGIHLFEVWSNMTKKYTIIYMGNWLQKDLNFSMIYGNG